MTDQQQPRKPWPCPSGEALRAVANALQRANGTSLLRHVPPLRAERDAWDRWDQHVTTCADCR